MYLYQCNEYISISNEKCSSIYILFLTMRQLILMFSMLYILTARHFTKDDMDLIYESYVIAKLHNDSNNHNDVDNVSKPEKLFANSRAGEFKGEQRQISGFVPDAATLFEIARTFGTSVAGIMAFLSANSDVLTALGIVSQLEAKTQYDPRFRNSIPRLIRENAPDWIL